MIRFSPLFYRKVNDRRHDALLRSTDAWMRVWVGLWMIVIGAAATAVSALLSEAVNAGIMIVAVGPVLYGVFSVFWGLAGMFKRRG